MLFIKTRRAFHRTEPKRAENLSSEKPTWFLVLSHVHLSYPTHWLSLTQQTHTLPLLIYVNIEQVFFLCVTVFFSNFFFFFILTNPVQWRWQSFMQVGHAYAMRTDNDTFAETDAHKQVLWWREPIYKSLGNSIHIRGRAEKFSTPPTHTHKNF